jgi:putative ABC transport system permease protein
VRVGEHHDFHYVNFTTANLFDVLGVAPAQGRAFTQQEDDAGAAVAVVSAGFAERLGGAEAALGKGFEAHHRQYEIVGVMAAGFGFPHPETVAWIPWPLEEPWGKFRAIREMDSLRGVARLKRGVTAEEAERDLDAIGAALAEEYPPSATFAGFDANVVPLLDQVTGADLPRLLRVMLAGVALLFVIACVNLMNLVLVRNEARSTELGVREALGASGWEIRRGRIVEACVVAGGGLAAGVALAQALVGAIAAGAPAGIPRIEEARLDGLAIAIAAGLALLAVVVAALAPAKPSRLVSGARSATASGESRRLQSVFVVAQAAIALVLLCGTALFAKSFLAALELDPGYAKEGILLATLDYREGEPDEVHGELLRRLKAYPGVEQVGGTSAFQIALNPDISIRVLGREQPERIPLTGDHVIPGYFETLRVPLLRGRAFTGADLDQKVTVINETMARQIWLGEDPIGAVFEVEGNASLRFEVVGVVGDMRRQGLEREPIAQMFRPAYTTVMTVAVRTDGDREALGNWIREEYARISPSSVPVKLTTVEQTLEKDLAPRRFYTLLLVGFAALALTLTAVGLFGLMAYVVERRTREIGVRMAVGARPADILAQVMSEGARLVLAGCAVGFVGVLWTGDLLAGLLFETSGRDALSLAAAAAALVLTGLIACYLPARRAAAADPTTALRSE